MPTLTTEIIEAAIDGFEAQKRRLDIQIGELRALLNGGAASPARQTKPSNGKRKMSAATLQRMREGQQRRWAKVRGQEPKAETIVAKPKRKLSAGGKAAIVAALKKRWAAKRAANASEAQPAPAVKKGAPKKKAA